MGEHITANEDGTFTVHVHGPVADKMIALLAENADLREALAKSASREAALVEKLNLSKSCFQKILDVEFLVTAREISKLAIAKIKEAS